MLNTVTSLITFVAQLVHIVIIHVHILVVVMVSQEYLQNNKLLRNEMLKMGQYYDISMYHNA